MPIRTTGAGTVGSGGGGNPPSNTSIPIISGSLVQGSTLTTTNGTWTNSPTSFDYQWLSNGTPVGLDQNTYITQVSDIGDNITVVVTASNGAGSGNANSDPVGPITATPAGNIIPEITYHSLVMN